ncbi:MAG: porin family protein [Ferruginibacter sp.]
MKKIAAFSIISLFCSLVLNAQSFHFGLKAGANLQKINGIPFKDKFTFGYQAGAYATIGLSKKIGVQPELLFSSVNADTASQFSTVYGFKQIDKIRLNYLDIPVLLNIKAAKFLTIQAGPQFSVLLDKNKSLLKNGETAFKDGNIAAAAGLQFKFSKIRVYGRYVAGLNNLNDVDNSNKWRNRNIQVGVGYNIF